MCNFLVTKLIGTFVLFDTLIVSKRHTVCWNGAQMCQMHKICINLLCIARCVVCCILWQLILFLLCDTHGHTTCNTVQVVGYDTVYVHTYTLIFFQIDNFAVLINNEQAHHVGAHWFSIYRYGGALFISWRYTGG